MGNQELINRLRFYAGVIHETTSGADQAEVLIEKALREAADILEKHDTAWYAALKRQEELKDQSASLRTDDYFRLQGITEIINLMDKHTNGPGGMA